LLVDGVAGGRLGLGYAAVGGQTLDLLLVVALGFQIGAGLAHHLMEAVIAVSERSGAALDAEFLRRHAHDTG
jgi:hypothetical protein